MMIADYLIDNIICLLYAPLFIFYAIFATAFDAFHAYYYNTMVMARDGGFTQRYYAHAASLREDASLEDGCRLFVTYQHSYTAFHMMGPGYARGASYFLSRRPPQSDIFTMIALPGQDFATASYVVATLSCACRLTTATIRRLGRLTPRHFSPMLIRGRFRRQSQMAA